MEVVLLEGNWSKGLEIDLEYDLIYLDPPFFTQKTHKMNKKGYVDGIITHPDTHFDDLWNSEDEYIDWLVDVFVSCFNKLKPSGSIYSHNNFIINSLLNAKLPKNIRSNFSTNISWQRSGPHNNVKKTWGNIVDSIMVFNKTKKPYFNVQFQPLNKKYEQNSFKHKDENGNFALIGIAGEKSRVGHFYTYKDYTPTYGWRYKIEDVIELDNKGELYFGKNKPYRKQYLHKCKGVPIQNIWTDIFYITRSEKNKREYPTQKPVKLLNRIIKSSCPKDGIMLDPFCGAGTSAIAAYLNDLPSKVILVDKNKEALDIVKDMIEKIRSGYKFGLDDGDLLTSIDDLDSDDLELNSNDLDSDDSELNSNDLKSDDNDLIVEIDEIDDFWK